jgi:recombination protein RecA
VVKNKVAPPFRQAEFEILYGEGTSCEGELIELGVLNDLVEKSGAWYSYAGERIGQGKENARQYFKDNPVVAKQLDEALRAKLLADTARKGGGVAATEDAEEVEA